MATIYWPRRCQVSHLNNVSTTNTCPVRKSSYTSRFRNSPEQSKTLRTGKKNATKKRNEVKMPNQNAFRKPEIFAPGINRPSFPNRWNRFSLCWQFSRETGDNQRKLTRSPQMTVPGFLGRLLVVVLYACSRCLSWELRFDGCRLYYMFTNVCQFDVYLHINNMSQSSTHHNRQPAYRSWGLNIR